jgi:hypothetical protein
MPTWAEQIYGVAALMAGYLLCVFQRWMLKRGRV